MLCGPPPTGRSSFAFLGSATLAQDPALRARREKLLLRKTQALGRVFAFLLALGRNLCGFRITRQAKGAGQNNSEVIMSNNNLQKKAVRAATRFCEHKGYEILDAGWTSPEGTTVDLVAEDEGCLVFIDVAAKEYGEGSLEDGKIARSDFEVAAAAWLAAHPDTADVRVRFDIVAMLAVSGSRAFLRHHINAFSCGAE